MSYATVALLALLIAIPTAIIVGVFMLLEKVPG